MNATDKNTPSWCVIIPTYNNAKTLQRVIDGGLEYTSHIFIINDGSTDETPEILKNYPQIHRINLPINKGKGYALQKRFKMARQQGFDYAITIDSDGQHYPSDIPIFLENIYAVNEPVLLIGS